MQQQPGSHGQAAPPGVGAAIVPAGSIAQQITHGPSFAMLRLDLAPGQTIVAEAGSMVARHQSVTMEAKLNAPGGGAFAMLKALIIALIRKFVGGETFLVNHFSAPQGGSVWLAPTMSGPVVYRRLQGETLVLSTGAYLAHCGDVRMGLKFGGLRGLLAKEGAFFLEVTGHGDLWFTRYGGVEAVDVNGPFTVDNGHLVGYEGNLSFGIGTAGGGVMGMVASGEGLVCKFNGQGRIYIQSRNTGSLVSWLSGMG
ncbi:MAG TPA: TIGR00266 family protein [Polyangiaceae bacterium]|nr:TIGR00266 family protein [Polyangiaceae bacterium]